MASGGSFIYSVSTTAYNTNSGFINPIININNSFTGLTSTIVSSDGTTTVTWSWTAFNDNGTTNDGLKISNNTTNFNLNVASLNIIQFGSIPLSRNSNYGFAWFAGIISSTAGPTILTNTNFKQLFTNSTIPSANFGNLSSWNVSNVTNMFQMFEACSQFNQPINTWNVSNVTDMNRLFNGCSAFNQPIGSWNTSKVTDMRYMFYQCNNFNQPLTYNSSNNYWNTSSVTLMVQMFYNCNKFNQDISSWNTAKVIEMTEMFLNCSVFNQPIGTWNFTNMTSMNNMILNTGYVPVQYGQFLIDLSNNTTLKNNLILGYTNRTRYNVTNVTNAYSYLTRTVANGGKQMTIYDSVINATSPTASVISGTTSIYSDGSCNLSIEVTGGISPYTVILSDGSSKTSASPVLITVRPTATTTYEITSVKDANGMTGTGNTGYVIVTVLANIINTTTVTAYNTYTWSNNSQTYTTSGIYTGNTTGHTDNILNLTINYVPTASVISGTTSIYSDGSCNLSIAVTGGISPYTVILSDGSSKTSTSPVLISVRPTATTTYTITSVTDASGTPGTGNIGSAIVDISANLINTTTVTADNTYTWSNNGQTYTTTGIYQGTTTGHTDERLDLTINNSTLKNPVRMAIFLC